MAAALSDEGNPSDRDRWSSLVAQAEHLFGDPGIAPLGAAAQCRESALLAHAYACMAADAACNEIAEELISFEEVSDFHECKRQFRKGMPKGVKLLVWKWRYLFSLKGRDLDPQSGELGELGRLVLDRNALLHYSPADSATKLVFDGPPPQEGNNTVLWSTAETPTRVEDGLVRRLLTPEAAQAAVERAEAVFRLWNAVCGAV